MSQNFPGTNHKTLIDDRIYQKLKSLIDKLLFRKDSIIFHEPVDYIGLNLIDYPKIIKRPMDLGTVKRNLDNRAYQFAEQCVADIQLTYDNCKLYNANESFYYKTAQKLEEFTNKQSESIFGAIVSNANSSKKDTLNISSIIVSEFFYQINAN